MRYGSEDGVLSMSVDSGIFMCVGATPRHAMGRVGGGRVVDKANDLK